MAREHQAPILAWVCTAALVHLLGGGGADQVSRVLEERAELRDFARSVRSRLRPPAELEVTLAEDAPPSQAEPELPPEAKPDPKKAPEPKPDEPKKPEPEAKKADPKKPVQLVPTPAVPTPPPPPQTDRRIAIKQHGKTDEDNPEAKFIADEANKVEQETVAQITAHDQDDPTPTPGGNHSGPTKNPGNSEEERVGESDEHRGDPTHAPGESGREPTDKPRTAPPPAGVAAAQPARPAGARQPAPSPQPAPPPAEGSRGTPSPESVAQNGWQIDPARPGGREGQSPKAGPGASRLPAPDPQPSQRTPLGMLGLGGATTPNGINLNLTQQNVVAIVGEDNLRKAREADGERRRSAHRGSWKASSFERWRAAIENYVSSVQPGNQTSLNAARVPFASFLNGIHNRLHPRFAEDFLESLDELPPNHPLNEIRLVTRLEIVLGRDDGRVVKMGIVRTSGVTAFDIAALDAVQRASPYGKPPGAVVSPDGNVYLHWEFHRDPIVACSTANARPFMLNVPPAQEPAPPSPSPPRPGPFDPREQGVPGVGEGSRQGVRWPPPRDPREG